jgi:hypothetical protein
MNMKTDYKLEFIKKLPPITEEDREFKALNEARGGECVDLGEEIELKEELAKKLNWKPAKKPLIRVLARSGSIILYKDVFYHYMMDKEQAKDYDDYEELVKRERESTDGQV